MITSRFGRIAAIAGTGILALSACGSDNATNQDSGGSGSNGDTEVSGTLTGVGASSQQAAMTAWKDGFSSEHSAAQVRYSPDGSGAGREAFLAGGADFAGSDVALKEKEIEEAKKRCTDAGALNIPAYVSPIAISFNLPGIEHLNLDAETIAKIFQGKIKKWNDEAIASQNEGVDLPSTDITVVHRSDESGTTKNFTDYLHQAAPEVWTEDASGEWPSAYAAEAAKGTNGVVTTTSSTEGAITYADYSAVGDLGTVDVKSGDKYVEISQEAAANSLQTAERLGGNSEYDMKLKLDRTPDNGTYPVVLVSYHIVCAEYEDASKADLVKAFEGYVVSEEGQKAAAKAAGSAPLIGEIAEDARAAAASISAAK